MQFASRGSDFVRCRLDSWGRKQDSEYCRKELERYARGDATSVFASPGMSAGAFLRSPFAREREPDVQVTRAHARAGAVPVPAAACVRSAPLPPPMHPYATG